ncbi:class I SAM-dependent methyltransferase [Dyadobacter flavalbus]|uniref:Class I SAM-dependent methyltransferase n=1 Tax=Dyadobacter flavalbus TaxID=2579942 RepID=A0A5M8R100_9BACT|nr:class I SAM-dependent methyltransferase [Dyadobacter flavalbus]KAA6440363.1 class I SAM-dependent methyltransferase [Dyadobacter flavalbus]
MIALLNTAERINDSYQINSYVFQRHVFAYKAAIKYLKGLVIELGCGTGYGLEILSPYCDWIAGVDKYQPDYKCINSKSAVFRSYLPQLNNIGSNSFNTVICFQVIEHIEDDVLLLNEIHRILKPGGKVILTTPNKLMSLTRNPHHIREYTPETMKELVASNFKIYDIKGVYGNSLVMQYFESNKINIRKFSRLDIFNLQYRLPAVLWKIPYDIANNINRFLLYQQNAIICDCIKWNDYYLDHVGNECLDFFVVAEKDIN